MLCTDYKNIENPGIFSSNTKSRTCIEIIQGFWDHLTWKEEVELSMSSRKASNYILEGKTLKINLRMSIPVKVHEKLYFINYY